MIIGNGIGGFIYAYTKRWNGDWSAYLRIGRYAFSFSSWHKPTVHRLPNWRKRG
jgi:hypothetical protein